MTIEDASPLTFDAAVDAVVVGIASANIVGFRPTARLERLTRHCAADQEFFDQLSTRCRLEAVLYAAAKAVHRGA